MTSLLLDHDPLAVKIALKGGRMLVDLKDGRTLTVPLTWYPRLQHGTPNERRNWQLLGDGYAVEWPDLDEHIGVEALLAGRCSGESAKSLKRWLAGRRTKKPAPGALREAKKKPNSSRARPI